jgi:hypothetical protein
LRQPIGKYCIDNHGYHRDDQRVDDASHNVRVIR